MKATEDSQVVLGPQAFETVEYGRFKYTHAFTNYSPTKKTNEDIPFSMSCKQGCVCVCVSTRLAVYMFPTFSDMD